MPWREKKYRGHETKADHPGDLAADTSDTSAAGAETCVPDGESCAIFAGSDRGAGTEQDLRLASHEELGIETALQELRPGLHPSGAEESPAAFLLPAPGHQCAASPPDRQPAVSSTDPSHTRRRDTQPAGPTADSRHE